jgi:hypothetical protein
MADGLVSIGADLSGLRRELAAIPNLSGEAAQAMLVKLEKSVVRAESAAKKAYKATAKAAAEAAKASDKANKEIKDGVLELADLAGLPADGFKKLEAGLVALVSPAGMAAVAIGAAGLAAAGAVAGIYAAVRSGDELARTLQNIKGLDKIEGFGIDAQALKSLDAANAAIDSLSVIAQRLVVELGAEFAPAVEGAALFLVKLGLAGLDAFQAIAEGEGVMRSLATFAAGKLVDALTRPVEALVGMVETTESLARVLGQDAIADKLAVVGDTWDGIKATITDGLVDLAVSAAGVATGQLSDLTADYDERARALVGTLERHNAAQRDGGKAAEVAKKRAEEYLAALEKIEGITTAATVAQLSAEDKLRAAANARIAEVGELQAQAASRAAGDAEKILAVEEASAAARLAIEGELQASIGELRDQEAQKAAERAERIAAAEAAAAAKLQADLYSTAQTFLGGVESLLASTSDAMGESAEKGARRAFIAAQAIAAVQATMAALKAGAEAAAAVAGIPIVGPALALPAGIATFAALEGAFVAKIAAQEPPSFGDTPGVQFSPGGGLVEFAPGDYFAAAKDPAELLQQAMAMGASSGPRAAAPASPRRAAPPPPSPAPVVVVTQQRGTITDERVNRLRAGGLGPLSRADAQRVLGKRSS